MTGDKADVITIMPAFTSTGAQFFNKEIKIFQNVQKIYHLQAGNGKKWNWSLYFRIFSCRNLTSLTVENTRWIYLPKDLLHMQKNLISLHWVNNKKFFRGGKNQ